MLTSPLAKSDAWLSMRGSADVYSSQTFINEVCNHVTLPYTYERIHSHTGVSLYNENSLEMSNYMIADSRLLPDTSRAERCSRSFANHTPLFVGMSGCEDRVLALRAP